MTSGGYIDELVQTTINGDPVDDPEMDPNDADHAPRNFYSLHNANYNVMALIDDSGELIERYEYTPYGERQVYFSAGSNDPLAMSPTSMSRRVDVGGVEQPYGICDVGHQGLFHDDESGLIYNRARMLHPRLGRFMQRDPLNQNLPIGGYQDGLTLYQYLRSNPMLFRDLLGLEAEETPIIEWNEGPVMEGGQIGLQITLNLDDQTKFCCDKVNLLVTFTADYESFTIDSLWGVHSPRIDDGTWRGSDPSPNAPYFRKGVPPESRMISMSDYPTLGPSEEGRMTFVVYVVCEKDEYKGKILGAYTYSIWFPFFLPNSRQYIEDGHHELDKFPETVRDLLDQAEWTPSKDKDE